MDGWMTLIGELENVCYLLPHLDFRLIDLTKNISREFPADSVTACPNYWSGANNLGLKRKPVPTVVLILSPFSSTLQLRESGRGYHRIIQTNANDFLTIRAAGQDTCPT